LQQRIERIDDIPLLLHWLDAMRVQESIDSIWLPHGNRGGLSYGQLASLFVTYVVHSLNHRLYQMEEWLTSHLAVIQSSTGWDLTAKDATDDRLARMLEVLGSTDDDNLRFQREMGRHLIEAYELPTEVARYDTTSFSVYHAPGRQGPDSILRFGYSKDHRPDLPQFKQGLATLDPAGLPLFSETLPGNGSDDPLYFPAWRQLKQNIGHADFLYVADCKASALSTRAAIDQEGGFYLFPLPMTGEIPEQLCQLVLHPPAELQPIFLAPTADQKVPPTKIGQGFAVHKPMQTNLDGGSLHGWNEQWFVVQSHAYAESQTKACIERIQKAEQELQRLKPKKAETPQQFQHRAEKVLENRDCQGLLTLEVRETVTQRQKYLGRGRPKADSPRQVVELRQLTLRFQREDASIEQRLRLAGWRIYVSNMAPSRLSLRQSVRYYREEWRVERGFHRYKEGSLPVLPLFLRVPERIKGLMMLLTVALQAITLLEYVARRELAAHQDELAGLVPGNPKMKTRRPTAERLLAQFTQIHLLIEESDSSISGRMVEALSPIQLRILGLLHIPATVYAIAFSQRKFDDSS